ncbi:hypothetical protein ANCDUO_15291, partial [Ancylostoma duodenale]
LLFQLILRSCLETHLYFPFSLFVYVNETLYQRPVYANFITVVQKNLFTPDVCKAEASMSGFRKSQIQLMVDTWTSTQVFNLAFQFLKDNGFEHVFIGEWKSGTVDGQHSWVTYYNLQKADKINYHGYYSYVVDLTGTFQYVWENEMKKKGGFLIGTSPDIGLFTTRVIQSTSVKQKRRNTEKLRAWMAWIHREKTEGVDVLEHHY